MTREAGGSRAGAVLSCAVLSCAELSCAALLQATEHWDWEFADVCMAVVGTLMQVYHLVMLVGFVYVAMT